MKELNKDLNLLMSFVTVQLPLSHADSVVSPKSDKLNFSFVYIAHPRAVNGLSWRKTSKYMPRLVHVDLI